MYSNVHILLLDYFMKLLFGESWLVIVVGFILKCSNGFEVNTAQCPFLLNFDRVGLVYSCDLIVEYVV